MELTATNLHSLTANALAIARPAEWDSPESDGGRDALLWLDNETWALAPTGAEDADYMPIDAQMARQLIESHLRGWLLARAWQIQVTISKENQRWRLVDCLSIADGGGDRLDTDYPHGDDELTVLCESVAVVAQAT